MTQDERQENIVRRRTILYLLQSVLAGAEASTPSHDRDAGSYDMVLGPPFYSMKSQRLLVVSYLKPIAWPKPGLMSSSQRHVSDCNDYGSRGDAREALTTQM